MPHFYSNYIQRVPEGDLLDTLCNQTADFVAFLQQIPDAETLTLHPPYTWTLRQVLGHIIDSERIFAYRALRTARGDQTPLPGYDENVYAVTGQFNSRPFSSLMAEWTAVRAATTALVAHFPAEVWQLYGEINETQLTVRELVQSVIGHIRHHQAIMINRLYPSSQ